MVGVFETENEDGEVEVKKLDGDLLKDARFGRKQRQGTGTEHDPEGSDHYPLEGSSAAAQKTLQQRTRALTR